MFKSAAIAALLLVATNTILSSSGAQLAWVRDYDSGYAPAFDFPEAVAVDSSGNVYVTGGSSGANGVPDYDYATIKYSSSGDILWVQRYNGPGNSWDAAHALVLDGSGNAYVTGVSYGDTDFDYVTIKYSAAGVEEWVARYNNSGVNSEDWATAIAIDTSGNVYVTGYSAGADTFYDYATVKYNPAGGQEWVARFNGPGNTKDRAQAIAVDGSGNVYVTGDSGEGSFNLSDYVTVKYNSTGARQWTARYHNAYDYPTAVAVDSSGNVYVTGYSYGTRFYDYATIKYTPNGRQRWVARYDGASDDDVAYALAVDASGNVYVTGESVGRGTSTDYATVKYDTRGKQRWVGRYNGPGNATDGATDIAVDAAGNVYVTGASRGSDLTDAFATLKYSAVGKEQWVARYDHPGAAYNLATALALDASGAVYVTGRSTDLGFSLYTTVKYSQTSTSDATDPAGRSKTLPGLRPFDR